MLGIIIPTDFHIFQRGRYTTNQVGYHTMLITVIMDELLIMVI